MTKKQGEKPPRVDVLLLCQRAGDLLKAAGFELRTVSMKSEACYYVLPGRYGLLRVSCHPHKGGKIGQDDVVATITFRGGAGHRGELVCRDERFATMVYIAMGQYLERSVAPRPSKYRGKRGTWEAENQSLIETTGEVHGG